MTATTVAALTASPVTKLMPMMIMPSSEMTTVVPANSTARPAVSMASTVESRTLMPVVQVLPVPGDDEQRVVDADAEADHHAEDVGEVGRAEEVAEEPGDDRADADAGEGDADGQAHREHRAEGEQEDHDREAEAERLGRRRLELGEDLTAELDVGTPSIVGVTASMSFLISSASSNVMLGSSTSA